MSTGRNAKTGNGLKIMIIVMLAIIVGLVVIIAKVSSDNKVDKNSDQVVNNPTRVPDDNTGEPVVTAAPATGDETSTGAPQNTGGQPTYFAVITAAAIPEASIVSTRSTFTSEKRR